ncbi:MAG: hypothetical protein ACREUY_01435 [Burkholderiales bacterium]
MTDTTVSVRIDKRLHDQMRLHEDINWSAVLRKSIEQKIEDVERIDVARARRAMDALEQLRKKRAFDRGKPTGELLREWRERRR